MMPNPMAGSRLYARLGNAFTRPLWSVLRPPSGFGILTTKGRRTGRPRRQSVRAIQQGNRVVVVAMMGERAQWLKNIRSDPQVAVRLRNGTVHGTAREARDEGERQWAADVYIGTTVPNDYVDYAAYHWGFPTRSKIEQAHKKWFEEGVPVAIEINSTEGR